MTAVFYVILIRRYSDSLRAVWSGDRMPVGTRFSAPVQNGPGDHPASYTMDTGYFPEVLEPGLDHPLPSSAEAKERVELYLYSLSGPSWPVLWWTLLHDFNTKCFFLGKSRHQANLEYQRKNYRMHYIKPLFMLASILEFSALGKMRRIRKNLWCWLYIK